MSYFKTTTYYINDDGLLITENKPIWVVYFGLGLIAWLVLGWSFPSVNALLFLSIAAPFGIIAGMTIFTVKPFDALFHKKTMIPWYFIVKAEMGGQKLRHLRFYFREGIYPNNMVEYYVSKANETEIEQSLHALLGENFIVN